MSRAAPSLPTEPLELYIQADRNASSLPFRGKRVYALSKLRTPSAICFRLFWHVLRLADSRAA